MELPCSVVNLHIEARAKQLNCQKENRSNTLWSKKDSGKSNEDRLRTRRWVWTAWKLESNFLQCGHSLCVPLLFWALSEAGSFPDEESPFFFSSVIFTFVLDPWLFPSVSNQFATADALPMDPSDDKLSLLESNPSFLLWLMLTLLTNFLFIEHQDKILNFQSDGSLCPMQRLNS